MANGPAQGVFGPKSRGPNWRADEAGLTLRADSPPFIKRFRSWERPV
jgi:hypothetical protein